MKILMQKAIGKDLKMTKFFIVAAGFSGIFADAFICKLFDIMPVYMITAPMLAILSILMLIKIDEKD